MVVTLDCKNLTSEGMTHEMVVEANVFLLGEIIEDLHKKVVDLEA